MGFTDFLKSFVPTDKPTTIPTTEIPNVSDIPSTTNTNISNEGFIVSESDIVAVRELLGKQQVLQSEIDQLKSNVIDHTTEENERIAALISSINTNKSETKSLIDNTISKHQSDNIVNNTDHETLSAAQRRIETLIADHNSINIDEHNKISNAITQIRTSIGNETIARTNAISNETAARIMEKSSHDSVHATINTNINTVKASINEFKSDTDRIIDDLIQKYNNEIIQLRIVDTNIYNNINTINTQLDTRINPLEQFVITSDDQFKKILADQVKFVQDNYAAHNLIKANGSKLYHIPLISMPINAPMTILYNTEWQLIKRLHAWSYNTLMPSIPSGMLRRWRLGIIFSNSASVIGVAGAPAAPYQTTGKAYLYMSQDNQTTTYPIPPIEIPVIWAADQYMTPFFTPWQNTDLLTPANHGAIWVKNMYGNTDTIWNRLYIWQIYLQAELYYPTN